MSEKKPVGIWGWALRVLAVGYPVALILVILGFRLMGERWWLTTVALYLPRAAFALPLPVLTILILLARRRALLLTQLVALLLFLFPLMGLRVSGPRAPTPDVARLRVLSFNISEGWHGRRAILSLLRRAQADIVVLQEVGSDDARGLRVGMARRYVTHVGGEFFLASRYPIEDVFEPPATPQDGVEWSPRFRRYRLATPDGPINVYNVHPVSPHDALDNLRGQGLRQELSTGRILRFTAPPDLLANTSLRLAQLQAIAEDAERSPHPVIIAGDLNLPGLSWALGHWFGNYQDGFAEVGNGFGYTFPIGKPATPWMRLDRILAGPQFRFVDFQVIEARASDHLAVVADIELPGTRIADADR